VNKMKIDLLRNWADRPAGMSDIYPRMATNRRRVENRLLSFFEREGYEMVSCGVFEYVDTLERGRSASERQHWIQLFDATGRAVALRPEMTPSIARMAAPLLVAGQSVIRWCYGERVYRRSTDPATLSWAGGTSAESTQVGVEWIGQSGVDVDCELLALCEAAIRELGITDWQLVVGHALLTPLLLTALGVGRDETDNLLQYLTRGDYVGFRETAARQGLTFDVLKLFSSLNPYDKDSIRHVNDYCDLQASDAGRRVIAAWEEITGLADELTKRGLREGIQFDFALHRDLSYYTGIVFEAFAPGVGAPIVLGGRYDGLLQQFGVNAPAIGFAFEVERILAARSPDASQTDTEWGGTVTW
jgi:ATP phosphoribosyltransferase regulatory subunit